MHVLFFSAIRGSVLYLPLNLLSLASYVSSMGCQVTIVDGQVDDDWRQTVAGSDADMLCVSSYTGRSIGPCLEAIELWRARGASRPVVWGGYHASLSGPVLFRDTQADYVVKGYGELALEHIIRAVSGAVAPGPFPGVAARHGGDQEFVPGGGTLNISALPSLNYDLIKVPRYFSDDRRVVQYVSSYGCHYACTFCAEPMHSGQKWRGRSPEVIVEDLEKIDKDYAPRRISFVDPNASSQPRRLVALVGQLSGSKLKAGINCNMRSRDIVRILDEVGAEELYRVGFRRVFIGVESGEDGMLSKLRKAVSVDEHVRAISELDGAGIEVQASFMHDLPGETRADASATIELAAVLAENMSTPGSVQTHHFYMPYPGTELFNAMDEADDMAAMPTSEWSNTSTYAASEIWRGDSRHRQWVFEQLANLRDHHPEVLTGGMLAKLEHGVSAGEKYYEEAGF